MLSCVVKDSQSWGKALTQCLETAGSRLCQKEQWQPKDFPVIFRFYQLNLDGQEDRVDQKLWNKYQEHFIEPGL